ncbi:hypothetical protein [Psychroserpens sp. SPM9]|uniref:hypothetical protein n=1 Tax=Psychroserpens sp. SPM9 TaxID=2975598 RepID=UPI0021A90610|nr:hypothetical protein [Psychroserpens sp. SPM9]MDG5490245.1 hypothetical protein [Psychroserpens sp. SPM9]
MRIKPHLLLFVLILPLFSVCQDLQKGTIIKDRQFLIDKKELTANDVQGNFVSIRPHHINGTLRNYHVEFFEGLNFKNRIEIETQNDTSILDVFILDEKAHVFIKERVDQSIALRLDIIDLKTQAFSKKVLLQIDKDSDKSVFKALKDDYFIDLKTTDYLILNFPVVEDKITYAYVKVFSKTLEEMTQIKVYADESISHRNTSFLNAKYINNTLFTLFQLSPNGDEEQRFYRLIELTTTTKRSLDIEIPADSYELINSEIKQNHMIIAGLYSHTRKGGYQGFTYYKIDLEAFEVTSQHQSPFLNESAKKYFTGWFKGNRNIDINNIFIDDELNAYVVGQFYILVKQSVPIGLPIASFTVGGISAFITVNPVSYSYKVFDDILGGKINPEGEIVWDNVLQLRQTEKIKAKSNKRDSSTFTFFANNEIHIFINGYIDMEKKPFIVKQDKRLNKTNFYDITVNQHGGITPNIVFPNADSDIIFRAESAVKSGATIHILGQGNMRKQLLKLKI